MSAGESGFVKNLHVFGFAQQLIALHINVECHDMCKRQPQDNNHSAQCRYQPQVVHVVLYQ